MSSLDASMTLMAAIRSYLNSDATLKTIMPDVSVGGVTVPSIFDYPYPQATTPYITLNDVSSSDWSTASNLGQEFRLRLSFWDNLSTNIPETLRIRKMQERTYQLLHYTTSITLASPYSLTLMRILNSAPPKTQGDGSTLYAYHTIQALIDHT